MGSCLLIPAVFYDEPSDEPIPNNRFDPSLARRINLALVSFVKPYKAVTSSMIGHWTKTVLASADIDVSVFSAHSTRCASASKAIATISVDMLI